MLLVIIQSGRMSLRNQRRRQKREGASHRCHAGHGAVRGSDAVIVDVAKAEKNLEDHRRKRNPGGRTSSGIPRHHWFRPRRKQHSAPIPESSETPILNAQKMHRSPKNNRNMATDGRGG